MKDIPIDDLKVLVDEIIQQRTIKEKEKRRNFWFDFFKVTLTPLIIAFVGFWGTNRINEQNLENTQLIAEQQLENTKLIAKQQIEAARIRAERVESSANSRSRADRDVERLDQIKDVFKDIIDGAEKYNNKHHKDYTSLKVQISSLEVYGDQAIPFLIKIRDIYRHKAKVIADHADETVLNILQVSRANFTGYRFIGKGNAQLNLRKRNLQEFTFDRSIFDNVNLYQAKFNHSSLENVIFRNVDLTGADFSEANLSHASFEADTNLRNANFSRAYLKHVEFKNCINLSDAKFSIFALLNADQNPFKAIEKKTYLKLLIRNITDTKDIEGIKTILAEDTDKLSALLAKVGMEYNQLISYLQEKHRERIASAKKNDNRVDADA